MRSRYILLADTPELKKGAIVQEDCDNGDQDFTVISHQWDQKQDSELIQYSRNVVTESPEWFEKVDLLWLTQTQIEKVKKLLKI
jgi:hypothetical protein